MTKQTNLIPKRRFKGLQNTSAWEQYKIDDYAEVLTGGTPKTQLIEYWKPKEIPWMSSGEVNKKRLKSTDNMISIKGFENSSVRWVKENSILIALAGQGKTRGTVAINEIPLTTNQSIAAIVPKEGLYYEFLFQNLEKRYEELRLISSGEGTRGGLNKKLVSDLVIISPPIEEQVKVGDFLKQLDTTIALQQSKVEKIIALKSAYLSEMFPAEGEDKPKRRFAGFTQAWEQSKLSELANYRRGSFPQPYGDKDWYDEKKGMPFVQVVDVGNNLKLVNNTKQKISKLAQPFSVFVEKDKVIITLQGSIGRVAITQYPCYVDRTLLIFESYKRPINNYYFAYIIQQLFAKEKLKAPGGTIKTITKEVLSEFHIFIPSIEEQNKIAEFLKQLDNTIAIHQHKLEKLRKLKKAYLHEMFI
ncbi:HsdS specificity protein of type I restriction-modification system [Rossellomorea marisflavi]|uniref:restriction endonuclease subunit S n=1 Tax=Rossellomorea marisflavi TaxID=189381 RepID=UPI0025C88149|nr:restriction endonuclease subunit S [Rossellomorea marisflavi]GLI85634.1 HsdS specificity protein of type I restriction-modification system [Rossellomorea marisflavi]